MKLCRNLQHGALFTVLLCCILFTTCPAQDAPNIIIIVADDLGFNDLSFRGYYQIPTPNIDAIAKDGIIMNNYYVSPICTPSRGSLFSGKYSIELGLQHYAIGDDEPWGLSTDVKIMPQYLKELGYTTHGIGKWHLGFYTHEHTPAMKGFETFFGYWNGYMDYFTHYSHGQSVYHFDAYDLHENEHPAWKYKGNYSTDLFTDKAVELIENHNGSKPLFLYLGYQAVHAGNAGHPLEPPPDKYHGERFKHIKGENREKFAGVLHALDLAVGRVFAGLERSDMLDNTLIVFTADNGAPLAGWDKTYGSNWPLRGGKYTMWEGGVRANSFVWSSQLRKNSRKDETLFHITDWLPTFYALAGGDVSDLGDIDGVNQWPAISGGGDSGRDSLLHNIDPIWKTAGARKGKYKLVVGSFNSTFDNWFDRQGNPEKPGEESNTDDATPSDEKLKEIYKEAEAVKVLEKVFGASYQYCPGKNDTIKTDCGERPSNFYGNCNPKKGPCLFDVENDPCEYTSIADKHPDITQDLQNLLLEYSKKAIRPSNKKADPNANPARFDGVWHPWISDKLDKI